MHCPVCQKDTAFVAGRCVNCGHEQPAVPGVPERKPAPLTKKTTPIPLDASERPSMDVGPGLSPQGRGFLEAALAFGKKEGIGVDGDTLPTTVNVKAAGGWGGYVSRLKKWMPPMPSLGTPCGRTSPRALRAMAMHLLWAVLLSPVFLLVVGGVGYIGAWIVTFIASLIVAPLQGLFGSTSGLVVAAIAIGKKWVAVMGVVLIVPGYLWAMGVGDAVEKAGRRAGNENRGAALLIAFGAGFLTVVGAALCVQAWLVLAKPQISLALDNKEAAEAIAFVLGNVPVLGLVLGAIFGIVCLLVCEKSFNTGRVCPACHLQMRAGESVSLPIGVIRLLILAAKAGDATAMKGALRARPKMRCPDTPDAGPGVAAGKVTGYHCPGCARGIMDVEVATHSWGVNGFDHKAEEQSKEGWVAWSGELVDPELAALLGGGDSEEFATDGAEVLKKAAEACGAAEVKLEATRRAVPKTTESAGDTVSCWTLALPVETSPAARQDKANPPITALMRLLAARPMRLTDARGRALDAIGELSSTYDMWVSQTFLCPFNAVLPLSLGLPWGTVAIHARATTPAAPEDDDPPEPATHN